MTSTKPETPGSRERILEASGELFRRHGYAGTGIKAILTASQTPYGSLYHFFPDGKEELGVEALRAGGVMYRELVEMVYAPGTDVVTATRNFADGAAAILEATDFQDACPIATVALEIASTNEPMRVAAADAFESWLVVLRQRLVAAGVGKRRAREIAVELFCLIEGAFLLSRTTRETTPMKIAGRAAAGIVAAALPS
jgi:Transcriptional regulator